MTSETKELITQRRELVDRIKQVLIERLDLKLEPNEVTEDAPLFGMGMALDSIDALVLIVGIEDEFNITVDSGQHHVYRSINTLTDHLIEISAREVTQAANG